MNLEQQLQQLHPEFRTVEIPKQVEILTFQIGYNTKRIELEYIKSEPNLTLITELQQDITRMQTELNKLN
jgi:hypothetical protein